MKQPPSPPPEPLGECYINKLPNELLTEILAYLPPDIFLHEPPTYEQSPPIALVCKLWERNYDATQYQNIFLSGYSRWRKLYNWKVLKTLRQQAELCHHVRRISVCMDYVSEATNREIAGTIKSCRAIHTVVLHVDWSIKVWPIIHAIEMLPRLQYLVLLGPRGGVSLQMLVRHFNQPTLRYVELHRYGLARGDTPGFFYFQHEPPSPEEVVMLSVGARLRSSAISSLNLTDPSTPPICTMILLQWISKLVKLSLSALTCSTHGWLYALKAVELLLNVHRESLQHIMLGTIPSGLDEHGNCIAAGIPDFSKYPCLRKLQLSHRNLLFEKPSQAAAKLAAPVMCHLAISFSSEDQRPGSEDQTLERRSNFAEAESLWMVEFVSESRIREPNTRLKTISVDYDPWPLRPTTNAPWPWEYFDYDPWPLRPATNAPWPWEYFDDDPWPLGPTTHPPWPWEYLEQAEKELSRYNVAMTYSEPRCTKEKWDQMMSLHPGESGAQNGSQPIENDFQMLEISDDESQD